jgi:hypothetical protein
MCGRNDYIFVIVRSYLANCAWNSARMPRAEFFNTIRRELRSAFGRPERIGDIRPPNAPAGIVKSFGRRSAYESLRGTNPRATRRSSMGISLSGSAWWRRDRSLVTSSEARSVRVVAGSADQCSGERPLQGVGHETWREPQHRPQRGCYGGGSCQAVPGHSECLRVGVVPCGGALDWLQRAKVSMMIM